jgi:hypothetical protein
MKHLIIRVIIKLAKKPVVLLLIIPGNCSVYNARAANFALRNHTYCPFEYVGARPSYEKSLVMFYFHKYFIERTLTLNIV